MKIAEFFSRDIVLVPGNIVNGDDIIQVLDRTPDLIVTCFFCYCPLSRTLSWHSARVVLWLQDPGCLPPGHRLAMACTCLQNLPGDFLFYIAARVAMISYLLFSLHCVTTLSIERLSARPLPADSAPAPVPSGSSALHKVTVFPQTSSTA